MGVAAALAFAGGEHALAHVGGTFAWRVAGEIGGWYALHVHMQIDAIGQWPRQSGSMTFEIGDRTSAVAIVAAGVAAGARITGGDEGESRGEAYAACGAGHDDHAVFERLS